MGEEMAWNKEEVQGERIKANVLRSRRWREASEVESAKKLVARSGWWAIMAAWAQLGNTQLIR